MKPHDNKTVREFLDGYVHISEVREDFEWIDDVFSGVLELKTDGNTSTRSLDRNKLFTYLSNTESLSPSTFQQAYPHLSLRTCQAYTALARVVSKAIQRKLDLMTVQDRNKALPGLAESRKLLDQPYHAEMRPYGLVWPFQATKEWTPPEGYQPTPEWDANCLKIDPAKTTARLLKGMKGLKEND